MKINEILSEAKFSEPVMMYHGTDAGKIRSILKRGLDADAGGDGWGSEGTGSEKQRKLSPMQGVYLTRKPVYAYAAALSASKKSGEDPTVVFIQYQPGSSVVDEDFIDQAVKKLIDKGAKSDADIMNNLPDGLSEVAEKHPEGIKFFHKLIQLEKDRQQSYVDERVDPDTAEDEYHKALDKATVMFKSWNSDSVRNRESIGFSGNNKIIAIASFSIDDKTVELHYGKLPAGANEFFDLVMHGQDWEVK